MDFSEQEGAFSNLASQAVAVLALGLNTALDAALVDMSRMKWDSIAEPGDHSPFVNGIRKVRRRCPCSQCRLSQLDKCICNLLRKTLR